MIFTRMTFEPINRFAERPIQNAVRLSTLVSRRSCPAVTQVTVSVDLYTYSECIIGKIYLRFFSSQPATDCYQSNRFFDPIPSGDTNVKEIKAPDMKPTEPITIP